MVIRRGGMASCEVEWGGGRVEQSNTEEDVENVKGGRVKEGTVRVEILGACGQRPEWRDMWSKCGYVEVRRHMGLCRKKKDIGKEA